MRYLPLLLSALLGAQSAAAGPASQEDLARRIVAKCDNRTDRVASRSRLNGCDLSIERVSLKNCTAGNTPAQQASKVAKSAHHVDLATADSVKVSPVHGDTHLGLWPASNNLITKFLGRPTEIR